MIAVIDYQMGNLQSVINAVEKTGQSAVLVRKPEELEKYEKAILPGVGAFGDAMKYLKKDGMDEAIKEFAKTKKPILGICLGMQLLFEKSEEFGNNHGLGLIDGEIVLFDKTKFDKPLKIPHMGWNTLHIRKKSALLKEIDDNTYLYFVHSFHAKTEEKNIIGSTFYGYEFTSMVEKDNIFGFQPHPEKSHENGLKILKNFMEL
ncbi:MAG: imidazole glycerol phosphate synthase subunit HisH [Campylobacteraceae bacterium]|jgi:glutamine amidotransferase|nr:imidazole glycerol phosphate synthase subunit HisH [Campylobacteraceae bacterium]